MFRINKRIFKAGDYGKKGKWTSEDLQQFASTGKEFPVTPGHVGDWVKNGHPRTAIPLAGHFKCTHVDDEGFLCADINYNEFGDKVVNDGLYNNFSIGFDKPCGVPDHLAILGYAPPHLKDLDSAFSESSEFSEFSEEVEYIEFQEKGGSMPLLTPEAVASASLQDRMEAMKAIGQTITKEDKKMAMTLAELFWQFGDKGMESEFSEGFRIEEVVQDKPKTVEEIRAEVEAEFSEKEAKKIIEIERESFKEKFSKLFPPSLKPMADFTVDSAYSEGNYENLVEFSEGEKETMKDHLEKIISDGGPFQGLFKDLTSKEGAEFAANEQKNEEEEISRRMKAYGRVSN